MKYKPVIILNIVARLPVCILFRDLVFRRSFKELLRGRNMVWKPFYLSGWAYNNSKYTNAAEAVNGPRPVNSGPENAVNWYTSYTLENTTLKGLGFGFGRNFNRKNYLINSTRNGQFYTNEYTLINANVFYDRPRYRFSINAENLGNKKYYFGGFGTFTPGMLRRITASIRVNI